jgi:hypothetical protein
MSTPDLQPTADSEQTTTGPSDPARRQEVRNQAVALRAESRHARRQSAEVRGERNAILHAVALLATSTGVEIAVHLEDPTQAEAAKVALLERFPDPLSDVLVS